MGNHRLSLRYIVDVNEKAAQDWAAKRPGCKAVTTLDPVIADPEIKGIIVCTPTAAHREVILKAVRAGKAVMCEKPISLDVNELDECYEEAKRLNVPLLCGYQRRHDPSFRHLHDVCKAGGVGTVQIIKTISRDNPVPTLAYLKISGKIFHDCGSHDIDLCRWIAGEDPYEVYATASAFNQDIKALDDWDTVMITLRFPSGTIGSIDLSRKAVYGYDQRMEVLGDKGMVQVQNKQPTSTVVSTVDGVTIDPNLYSFPQRYVEAYARELDHFVDIMEGKATPLLTHDDARKVAIIAEAAEESCVKGMPIKIKYHAARN
jgi:myo-inositol 2-dehydrogenase/D-chiro-inositol 1-dehydrogenase